MSVGISEQRKDALEKVLGKARFASDYYYPDMLYGCTFRSPKPHIRIKSIQTSEAEKEHGVIKILTYKDIPGKNFIPLVFPDYPCLAEKKAQFAGQAIALVIADSAENARSAMKKIKLDYEELPAVFDPL
ncbi:MAG: hypothetical protein PHF84_06315, partial [bacterium]|nr:hypothetical protein [bacterium]